MKKNMTEMKEIDEKKKRKSEENKGEKTEGKTRRKKEH